MKLTTTEKQIIQCHKVEESLKNDLNREPLNEEVATEMGISVEKVRELLQLKVEEEIEENPKHELKFKLTIKNNELEKIRLAMGLKQEEVAQKIGIGNATYCQIECCRNYPDREKQLKIAKFFGKSIESLFPEWLKAFSQKWKDADKTRIVPISQLSLSSPELLQLESGDYERMIETADASYIVSKFINKLPEKEKKLIEFKYGFKDGEPKTLEEVGKEFRVTRERVRQIEAKAHERIRQYFKE